MPEPRESTRGFLRGLLGALAGLGASLAAGAVASAAFLGFFRLLDDSTIIPGRPMSHWAARRFLTVVAALIAGYLLGMWNLFRAFRALPFRVALLVGSAAVTALLLLNPWTECAVHGLQSPPRQGIDR